MFKLKSVLRDKEGAESGAPTGGENAQVIDNNEDLGGEVELPKVSAAAAKALTKGWQTKEDWTSAGKDPEEWISASHFNKNGDIFTQMQSLKHGMKQQDKRIADNNVYWQGQLQIQRDDLITKRDEAIDDSDKVAVKAIDKQINQIDQQATKLDKSKQEQVAASPEDLQAENAYFNNLTVQQAGYAQRVAGHFINNENLSGADLVAAVTKEVNKQFNLATKPAVNERREQASVTDTKKPSKQTSGKYTVDTLTAQDKSSLQAMRNISKVYANKSDAEMLKILNDSKR